MNLAYLAISLTTLLPAASPEVQVRTLDGVTVRGTLTSLSHEQLVITSGEEVKTFSSRQLQSVSVHETAAASRWTMQVALIDGSVLNCLGYVVADEKATLRFPEGIQRTLPVTRVRSVLLRNSGPELLRDWRNLVRDASTLDRLIVRRVVGEAKDPAERPAVSLDVMEGVIGNVGEDGVRFELDGDTLKIKREKVEGFSYFRRGPSLAGDAFCQVVDIDGSRWGAKNLAVSEAGLTIDTPAGLNLTLPWNHIRQLDYFAANAVYLSPDLLDGKKRESFLAGNNARDTAFRPLFDRTPEGVMQCGGKDYNHGLWLPAQSSLTFNVPEKFSRLSFLAACDDRLGNTDGAKLTIEADGKVLYEQTLQRSSHPTPVSLDLPQARRVRIKVDYAGESFLGDALILCEAMFTR